MEKSYETYYNLNNNIKCFRHLSNVFFSSISKEQRLAFYQTVFTVIFTERVLRDQIPKFFCITFLLFCYMRGTYYNQTFTKVTDISTCRSKISHCIENINFFLKKKKNSYEVLLS